MYASQADVHVPYHLNVGSRVKAQIIPFLTRWLTYVYKNYELRVCGSVNILSNSSFVLKALLLQLTCRL